MKILKTISSVILFVTFSSISFHANAHCEVPCGIYGDSTRIVLLYEHITTIEKSMLQIKELSKDGVSNYNQLVRWVTNKEEHAVKIQDIVSQYFLHQRIKISEPSNVEAYAKYTYQLATLHQILVFAMKAKQTTDEAHVAKLRELVQTFEHSYFVHEHKH